MRKTLVSSHIIMIALIAQTFIANGGEKDLAEVCKHANKKTVEELCKEANEDSNEIVLQELCKNPDKKSAEELCREANEKVLKELCKNANDNEEYFDEYSKIKESVKRYIGNGAFGKIIALKDDYHRKIVIKIIGMSKVQLSEIIPEIRALQKLTKAKVHGISSIHICFYRKSTVYIEMEPFFENSLSIYENTKSSEKDYLQVMKITRNLAEILRNIHSQGLCHNDVKPDNIMRMKEDSPELGFVDFGLATNNEAPNCGGQSDMLLLNFLESLFSSEQKMIFLDSGFP
jgi:tRNA A-37 threonylcarbamoyl transferase component Bud32